MLFRNRRVVRAIACYLLLQTISSLVFPSVSLAMMGPSQPEFTSYEAPGATDLVNLVTGDFTYSLPVLDIPGPERSFSLPLTYKAGIQLEQEASWVGLGWSVNVGAIARSVNGYADDANNEPTQSTFYKKIDRGWSSSFAGIVNLGWNSITGHGGSVDLIGLASVGWNEDGINRGDLVGIGYTAGKGVSVDPVRMAMAAYTIATLGGGSAATIAANIGIEAGKSAVVGVALSAIGLGHLGGAAGYNNSPTRNVESHVWGDNYWNFFNNNSTENAFGSLYFGKMSQNTVDTRQLTTSNLYNYDSPPPIKYGAQSPVGSTAKLFKYSHVMNGDGNVFSETAGDIYQDATIRDEQLLYKTSAKQNEPDPAILDNYYNNDASRRPISIAHDYFSVMGEAVSGTIRPYRLDVGSVAYPKPEANVLQEYYGGSDPTPILPHYKHMAIPFLDTKVGFRYENSLSNGYDYHQYAPTGTDEPTGFTISSNQYALLVTDPSLLTARTEGARKGLYDGNAPHLVAGKQVTWYSNAEIQSFYTSTTDGNGNGFLEFEHPGATTLADGSATNNEFRAVAPPSGIGAFAVTGEDGTTYHYSLPVYQYQTYSESDEISTPVGELGKMTRRTGISSATNPSGGQATAWLLTAITSADYIDRNNSGTVDAEDWGGWVKFEYGKFSSRYKWRQPYIGMSYIDENPTFTSLNFTEGYKETYYLNAVSTRSHTALFIKSVRQDGRGHFQAGVTATSFPASNLGIDERQPASSLRLDEIVLLDNATLNKLRTTDGIRAAGDPSSVPALTNSTGSDLGTYDDDPMAGAGDDMGSVLDVHDLTADSRISEFLNANALKRIHFNYSYDLCRSTPNSFQCQSGQPASLPAMLEAAMADNRAGKLTLRSVSFFGPTINDTPTKITPDFVFGYESASYDANTTNPAYDKEKWDAFGMYQPTGMMSLSSHKPAGYTYAAPWSLTTITSPLGGVTEIQYERDQYAHVSEYGTTKIHLSNTDCSATFTFSYPNGGPGGDGNIPDAVKPGQLVYLTGTAKYNDCVPPSDPYYKNSTATPANRFYQHAPFYVTSVSNTQITFQMSLTPQVRALPNCQNGPTPIGADFDMAIPNNLPGGDIRVAAITTKEGANAYQVRYKYTEPNTDNTPAKWYNSTGVLAKEPPFLGRFDHPVQDVFDYPNTPVLYSKVAVLRGLFRNNSDADYETKEVYSFYTPVSTMVTENVPDWKPITMLESSNSGPQMKDIKSTSTQTTVDVGKIGQPQKVEIYNRRGERELSTDFTYAASVSNADNISGQGHYTEGVLNTERVGGTYRVQRSTKEYVPAVLTASRSTRSNLSISTSNVLYDFLTGQILETAFTNSLGRILHTRNVPAYTLPGNEGMGAKGDDPANKHMLAQMGAAYTYIEVPGGPAYDPLNPLNPATSHVLSANVQTWQNNWTNYREPDANGTYQDVAGQTPVWRQAAGYTWQSPVLDTDGSYKDFTPFNWTGTPDSRWLKVAETVRYDHYSHALESRNVNGQYTTQKTGYNQTQLIASVSNARYTEVAYSGAEDQFLAGGITQFGGEVVAGGLPVLATPAEPAHTGFYSLQLKNGEKGFLYRAQVGRDIDADKVYRLSVWASATATDGKLYVARNGSRLAASTLTAATTKKAGNWYLLTLLYKVPASASGQTLEFGCANDGTTAAYFDDFRLAPLTATVTSKVYDPRTNNLLYSLDNDNLFTHYEYTPTGRLKRVYQETLDGTGSSATAEKLVKEYDYNYSRLFFPTWVTTVYRCVTDNDGNYTGSEDRQLTDVNPLNQPPTPMKWEANGICSTCLPPPVPFEFTTNRIPYRLRNNKWEQPSPYGSPTRQSCPQGYRWVFSWIYANGDRPADTFGDCMYGAN